MIRTLRISCITVTLLLLGAPSVFAMTAYPAAFEVSQPDGRKIKLHIRGDEWFHWHEDPDGFTVIKDNGRYAYAQLGPDDRLVPTPLTVGIDNPRAVGLQKRILPPPSARRSRKPQLIDGDSQIQAAPQAVPPSGTVKNLVILCMFSDHSLGVHTREPNDYDILFNRIGGDSTLAPTGSVRDLYLENSYGQMTLDSTVVSWVTLPQTEAYYADGEDGTGTYPRNAQGMVEDALDLVDSLVDFDEFDNDGDGYIDAIDIIHSGYGAETGGGGGDWIWSHRWSLWALPGGEWTSAEGVKVYDYHTEPALWGTSGTNIVRFGVIAHETGHFFGLPDLYDTDQSGEGIGSWGMMANSWGFDYTQLHPPQFCAWSKIELGWVTPTVISDPDIYTLDQVETSPQIYRIDNGYPADEYLLIENRQPVGIESAIPQGGLCIYHIDDQAGYNTEGYPGQSGWPENGNHYRVAVLQADGDYDLERNNNRGDSGDVYHAGGISEIGPGPGNHPNTDTYQDGIITITDNRIHSISSAGSTMSFTFGEMIIPTPPVATDVDEITQIDTPITITLAVTDEGLPDPPGALSYIVMSLPSDGQLSDPSGGVISSVPYSLLNNGNQVIYTPDPAFIGSDSFQFKANDGGTAPDGGDSNVAQVQISIVTELIIYSADMDTDPAWTYSGDWEWGVPQGSGGSQGNPDPTAGYTGSNVVGYNLSGDYRKIPNTRWTTTPAIDCSDRTDVTLSFYRWLNVESPTYDHAYVQVSNDNTNWTTVWENSVEVTDSNWTLQSFDISTEADNQSTVYIRWGMGATDGFWHYSGWNIDDVEITGLGPQSTLTVSSTSGGSVITPGEGVFQYNQGSVVSLNAVSDLNYHFVDWTGTAVTAGKVADPSTPATTVTMDNDYTVQANFAIDTFTLNYTAGSGGTLSGDTSQIVAYGSDGTPVTAVPNTGYYFVNWSDASTENPRTDINVTASISVAANFAITPITISGFITEPDPNYPIADVLITSDTEPNVVTDPNGFYEMFVDYGWSGTLTLSKTGYTFEPNSITYTNITADLNDDYIAILDTFIISGYAIDAEMLSPLAGVLVSPDNDGGPFSSKYYGGADVTDANGFYEVLVDYNFSGDIVPSKNAYAFEPNRLTYTNVTQDIVETQDYIGTLLAYMISGTIKNPCQVPIEGVMVDANNGGSSDVTDPNGYYEVWVDYDFSGTVTPSKQHYAFDPNEMIYVNVLSDQFVQDYTATNIYDLDCNGSIDLGDLAILCQYWLQTGQDVPGDFYKDEDDIVNLPDLAVFAEVWGD